MTCKDCVHFDVCTIMEFSSYDPTHLQEFGCNDFKNKADFVEVVRCKDCVHHTEDIFNEDIVWCEISGLSHLRNFYCACGKGDSDV